MKRCHALTTRAPSVGGRGLGAPKVTQATSFICAQCCADAKQLIEIQESIWGEPGDASDSANEPDKPARREPPDAP